MLEILKNHIVFLLKELRKEGVKKITISENTGISRSTLDRMFAGDLDGLTLRSIDKLFSTYPGHLPANEVIDTKEIEELKGANKTLVEQLEVLVKQIKYLQEQLEK